MSRQAHLSIVGLERLNPDLWDFMVYPDGWTDEQKADLLDTIRMECYELEVIYSDYVFMMNAIGRWARKEKPIWNALKATMEYEYNPIENTDRYEEEYINDSNQKTNSGNESVQTGNTRQHSGTDQSTGSGSVTNGGNDVTTNEVQGYDSAAYAPHDKSTVNYGGTQQTSSSESTIHGLQIQDSGTESKTFSESETGSGTRGRTLHTHGNIGTMTVQQMIKEQRDIAKFNLVDYIVDSFKQRFCILVY